MLCPERLAGRTGRGNRPRAGAHPPHPSASPPAASRIGPGAPRGASLPRRCGQPVGVGFSAVSPMASLASPSRCQQQVSAQQAQAPSRSALRAREALVRSAPRCRAGEPPAPYQRRCITGALHHHLRDRVRQVRSPHRLHEQRCCPLGHFSLDASGDSEPCLLDQLPAGPGCHRAPRHGQPSSTQRSGPGVHGSRQQLRAGDCRLHQHLGLSAPRRPWPERSVRGSRCRCFGALPLHSVLLLEPLPLLQACDRPGRSAVGRIREYGPTGTI